MLRISLLAGISVHVPSPGSTPRSQRNATSRRVGGARPWSHSSPRACSPSSRSQVRLALARLPHSRRPAGGRRGELQPRIETRIRVPARLRGRRTRAGRDQSRARVLGARDRLRLSRTADHARDCTTGRYPRWRDQTPVLREPQGADRGLHHPRSASTRPRGGSQPCSRLPPIVLPGRPMAPQVSTHGCAPHRPLRRPRGTSLPAPSTS